MNRKASRQETLQRRKVVYRETVDEEEDAPMQQTSEPASQSPPMSVQEQEKLKKLEDELARLRSEMAKFLNAASTQQQSSSDDGDDLMTPHKMMADPEAGFRTPAQVRRTGGSIPAPPPLPEFSSASAPAPPPPPPPMPVGTPKVFNKKSSMNTEDKENNPNEMNRMPGTPGGMAPDTPKPSLADMVRNASQRGSLRRVDGERSPGGTLKRKPSQHNGPASNSHTDVIAHALRMKFKVCAKDCPLFPPPYLRFSDSSFVSFVFQSMHRESPVSSPDKTFDNESM